MIAARRLVLPPEMLVERDERGDVSSRELLRMHWSRWIETPSWRALLSTEPTPVGGTESLP